MKKKIYLVLFLFVVLTSGFILGANIQNFIKKYNDNREAKAQKQQEEEVANIMNEVVPKDGLTLPISWGDLAAQLISIGVIDEKEFSSVLSPDETEQEILRGSGDHPVTIDSYNAQFDVDLLWAIGLAQKSIVYSQGPMANDEQVGNYASTGGWTLADGDATKYLNKYDLIPLNEDQQNRVKNIAQNVYRPCCGNSTWFPDCNHGMAALAAIEMMVSKNLSDEEVFNNILKLNSFWFPDTYLTVAVYFNKQGITWDNIDAKTVLGEDFSSAQGAERLQSIVGPIPQENSGGYCGA